MNKKKIFIAIMALSMFILSYMVLTPILASIYDNFSNYSMNQIQMIVTLVPLFSIITMFLCDPLSRKISMKNIALIGLIIVFIAGLLVFFIKPNLTILYVASILLGFGIGLITVISSTMISYYFTGKDKIKVMGYQSIFVSIGATLFSYFSGLIAAANWQYSYSLFFTALLVFFILILFLPNDKLEVKETIKVKIPKRIYLLGFISILFFISINVFNTSISMLVAALGYSSYTSGIATAIYTVVGILAGLILSGIVSMMKNQTLTFACFIAFVGLLILGLSSNIILIYIGSILVGFAFATRNPAGITFSANMVDTSKSALAIAIFSGCGQLGCFLSPYIINFINNNRSINNMFIVTGIFMLFVTLIHYFFNPIKNVDLG